MASIKNLNEALVKEPESAGAKIERRKNPSDKDAGEAPVAPKTAGAPEREGKLIWRSVLKQAERCTAGKRQDTAPNREARRIVMPPKPEPTDDPPVDAPTWTPDVREPDPDLLPDELPVPNPDENRDPPKRAVT